MGRAEAPGDFFVPVAAGCRGVAGAGIGALTTGIAARGSGVGRETSTSVGTGGGVALMAAGVAGWLGATIAVAAAWRWGCDIARLVIPTTPSRHARPTAPADQSDFRPGASARTGKTSARSVLSVASAPAPRWPASRFSPVLEGLGVATHRGGGIDVIAAATAAFKSAVLVRESARAAGQRLFDVRDQVREAAGAERRDRAGELAHVRETRLGRALQTACHRGLPSLGKLGAVIAERHGRLFQDRREDLARALAVERERPRQELVHDHADGPDIRARVDVLARTKLLRGHVVRRSQDGLACQLLPMGSLGLLLRYPEIENLDDVRAVVAEAREEIRRLKVSVDDAGRVRFREGGKHLQNVISDVRGAEGAIEPNELREIASLEEFHHEEGKSVVERARVGHADDMFASEARGRLGLAHEALDRLVAARRVDEEELEGHPLVEEEMVSGVDDAHATFAHDLFDAILPRDDVPRLGQSALEEVVHGVLALGERHGVAFLER